MYEHYSLKDEIKIGNRGWNFVLYLRQLAKATSISKNLIKVTGTFFLKDIFIIFFIFQSDSFKIKILIEEK